MAGKYIFKLTPNKKEVIINTEILLDGKYPDVEYPILYDKTSDLKYTVDKDTYKFVDSNDYVHALEPRPESMDMDLYCEDVSFYYVNNLLYNINIQFWVPNTSVNDSNTIVIKNTSGNVNYNASININWTDGCTHNIDLNNLVFTLEIVNIKNTFDDPDFEIIEKLFEKTYNVSLCGKLKENEIDKDELKANYTSNKKCDYINNTITINNDASIIHVYNGNVNVLKNSENILLVFRDTANLNRTHIADLRISSKYTDPNTMQYAACIKTIPIYQQGHKGYDIRYRLCVFTDITLPLDIWSPTLSYNYIHKDEANPKVDSDTYDLISIIHIDGTLDASYDAYKSMCLDQYVITDNEYPVYGVEYHKDNENEYYDISTGLKNTLSFVGIKVDNYFYNVDSCTFNTSNEDTSNFKNELKACIEFATTVKSHKSDVSNYECIIPGYNYNILKDSSSENINIFIDDPNNPNFIKYDTSLYAVYARYIIQDSEYYQISKVYIDQVNVNTIIYYDKTSEDFRHGEYKNRQNSSINKKDKPEIYDYKIVTTDDSKLTQYMYCVNNPIDNPSVLLPTYAVYPILCGYVPIVGYVYDFSKDLTLNTSNTKFDIITEGITRNASSNYAILLKDIKLSSKSNINSYISRDVNIQWDEYEKYVDFDKAKDEQTLRTYGAPASNYKLTLNSMDSRITPYIRINGVSDISCSLSNISPHIFSLSLVDYPYEYDNIKPILLTINDGTRNVITGQVLITNDEGEKHIHNYTYTAKDINDDMESFMLLRTNPKLSGNIKLVVDSDYNLYLDTFKASDKLNDSHYRKYPISAEGNYPRDIKSVFKSIATSELYKTSLNSLNPHKVYTSYTELYETMYEYGAETNTDVLYSENMKILAPIHIGKHIPEFFAIFRYNGVYNEETYDNIGFNDIDKFKSLLKDAEVINTVDLRQYTSIGQYLNNYKDMLLNYGYGQCSLLFIEQDNYQYSESYRQGKNIWKGILIKQGILTEQSETSYFANKILSDTSLNKQEQFNSYIINGFERHGLIYPNIINIEFMFNDNDKNEYSMHRYFGLYLYENDFIEYGYITDIKKGLNKVLLKYDVNGNLYNNDLKIFKDMFKSDYKDRMFYAVTNNEASRILSEIQVNLFFTNNVKNMPEYNIASVVADNIKFNDELKSFLTMHFNKNMLYGEHLKFILMDITDKNQSYINLTDKASNILYYHVVYEIIASNDERLRYTENNINPYVTTTICDYNNGVILNRISFYSQDIMYPEVSASIEDQIKRIIACINKFENCELVVSNHTATSLSVISSHKNTYIQHIAAPDLDSMSYDYLHIKKIIDSSIHICTTNAEHTESIDYISSIIDTSININDYIDDTHDYVIHNDEENDSNDKYYLYAEASINSIDDNISYYNKDIVYHMKPMSNVTEYYDYYYMPFANLDFEVLGWRYNNVVKFIEVSDISYAYSLHDDITTLIKNITTPLVYTKYNTYETIDKFDIVSGYLSNNIINPLLWSKYYNKHQLLLTDDLNIVVISNPFNANLNIICSNSDILLPNNIIRLYKPKSCSIAVMGIMNIKDLDTTLDTSISIHRESLLISYININEKVALDESDTRIQHGVMYEITDGILGVLSFDNKYIELKNVKFIVIPNDQVNSYNIIADNSTVIAKLVYGKTEVKLTLVDKAKYQDYNYTTYIPTLHSDYYFNDTADINNSDLCYSIVPSLNCNWKSTGLYLDDNNILDVKNFDKSYEHIGHFTESIFTSSMFESNQYVINKINSILYVDNLFTTYRDIILNKKVSHAIKKLLISNVNINTAVCHYNPNTYSLEFVYFGIKFVFKINDKVVNTYIHLDSYNNYKVFVINDYDLSRTNELFISNIDEFILLINHQFYIDYAHEADNNIKNIDSNKLTGYAPYSTYNAPLSIDFATVYNKYAILKDNIDELYNYIDIYNLWSSMFILEGNNNYIYSYLESIMTQGNRIKFFDYINHNSYINVNNSDSDVHFSYIMTKADRDYNTLIYKLLKSISGLYDYEIPKSNLNELPQQQTPMVFGSTANSVNQVGGILTEFTTGGIISSYVNAPNIEQVLEAKPNITHRVKDLRILSLSNVLLKNNFDILSELYTKEIVDKKLSTTSTQELKAYTELLLRYETPKEKLNRYIKSITDNIDIYVIPENSEYKYIANRYDNNPIILSATIPNYIKYNSGQFTPNTCDMLLFEVDDLQLSLIIDTDLLCANTNVKNIQKLINYTGNKVYNNQNIKLTRNFFKISERSLLSSTWDNGYYRLYTTEQQFKPYDGQITGIDDKSFFGSRCMVIKKPYILLDIWSYPTSNDLYNVSIIDSEYNTGSSNTKCLKLDINITSSIYNFFINNKAFTDNWMSFKNTLHTGMKNYINYTISSFYNMNSDIELTLYEHANTTFDTINIVDVCDDLKLYNVYENYKSSTSFVNNEFILTIIIEKTKGMDIHPVIKIYRK